MNLKYISYYSQKKININRYWKPQPTTRRKSSFIPIAPKPKGVIAIAPKGVNPAVLANQISANQISANQISANQISGNQISANQTSTSQISANKTVRNKVLATIPSAPIIITSAPQHVAKITLKKFTCLLCPRILEFNNANDLHLHQQSYHGNEVNWRICEFCQGLVGKGTDYHEHVLSMHGSYNEKTQVFQTTNSNPNFKTGKLNTT